MIDAVEAKHPLDANNAERSLGAPTMGRSAGVVVATTDLTVALSDDESTADGVTVPTAKRGNAEAKPDFRWNSCRFIATRFQLGLRAPPSQES